MRLTIGINPRKVGFVLAGIALCLTVLSLLTEYVVEVLYPEQDTLWLSLLGLFSVNLELSLPTWYATLLLLMAAAVLAALAVFKWRFRDRFRWHWAGLALIFLYLSLDESAAIHEFLADPINEQLVTGGYLYFGWQIVAVPVVLIFALVYLRFLFALPAPTRYGFIAAGGLYVGGAIFVEGLSAEQAFAAAGQVTYPYLVLATAEETCEMLGVVVFIYALLRYAVSMQITLAFGGSDTDTALDAIASPAPPAPAPDRLERALRTLRESRRGPLIIVFLAGVNLMLIQWVLVRELTALLFGTELVILLITIAYFSGLSVGYHLSGRIRRDWLPLAGAGALLVHITLPVWFRLLVTALDHLHIYGVVYLAVPLVVPFVISAFYSVFLPLFVDTEQSQLATLYVSEVLGAALGVACLSLLIPLGVTALLALYAAVLLGLLAVLGLPRIAWLALALVAITWLWFFPALNGWSNSVWFRQLRGLPGGTNTIFTGYSQYQKVDVLQDPSGSLYLYLDGLVHFDAYSGAWLNVVMGRIPASLTAPDTALVFGAGSMQLEAMVAEYAGHVTTVEIDPLVVDVSREWFTHYNRMDTLENRTVIVDDAKHYVANTDATYDLIVTDLPGPYTLQAGTLYSAPFFETVAHHLAPDGVFVVNLSSAFAPDDQVSRRIAASVLAVFDEVMVVTSDAAGWSFAYAGDALPFDRRMVEDALWASGERQFAIFETPAVQMVVGDAPPITLDAMDIVLQVSVDRLVWR